MTKEVKANKEKETKSKEVINKKRKYEPRKDKKVVDKKVINKKEKDNNNKIVKREKKPYNKRNDGFNKVSFKKETLKIIPLGRTIRNRKKYDNI